MAVKTKAQIHAEINSLMADNISGNITANDVRTCLHDMVDSYFDAPYKKYVALIDQAGTDNPTATVLENTLGGSIVWAFDSTGSFLGTLSAAFDVSKTVILLGSPDFTSTYDSFVNNVNSIYLEKALADGSSTPANGLTKMPIEIRVYP